MHPVKATSLLARRAGALLLALAIALACASAFAQATGGSFGGGDWGDSGGGSGGGSYGGSSDDDGSIGIFLDLVLIAFRIHPLFGLFVLVVGAIVLIAGAAAKQGGSGGPVPPRRGRWDDGSGGPTFVGGTGGPPATARGWMGADVTQLRIALDAAARPAFDQAFAQLMQSPDVRMQTKRGQLQILRRVTDLLRGYEHTWRRAAEMNYHPMSPPQASGVFQRLTAATRATAAQLDGAGVGPEGLFFLTLVVVARREIVDISAQRPEQIRRLLDDLARIEERDLVTVDLLWLPHPNGLALHDAELHRLHPDLKVIGETASPPGGAPVRTCPSCRQLTPQSAPRCVLCGAPRPS